MMPGECGPALRALLPWVLGDHRAFRFRLHSTTCLGFGQAWAPGALASDATPTKLLVSLLAGSRVAYTVAPRPQDQDVWLRPHAARQSSQLCAIMVPVRTSSWRRSRQGGKLTVGQGVLMSHGPPLVVASPRVESVFDRGSCWVLRKPESLSGKGESHRCRNSGRGCSVS